MARIETTKGQPVGGVSLGGAIIFRAAALSLHLVPLWGVPDGLRKKEN